MYRSPATFYLFLLVIDILVSIDAVQFDENTLQIKLIIFGDYRALMRLDGYLARRSRRMLN